MWSRSLWINETDTMSYAEHGVQGFGFGYGGYIFSLHILWSTFGEIDQVFRGLSLLCSVLTMILIYLMSEEFIGEGSGVVPSFIFACSSYSIEFGMQVREYAVHSLILMLITYWFIRTSRDVEESQSNIPEKFGILASFGVWYVSVHWFCMIYLVMLFSSFASTYLPAIFFGRNKEELVVPIKLLPPVITTILILSIQTFSMIRGIANSMNGEHHLGGGSVPLVILPPMDFLGKISSESVIVSILIISSLFIGLNGITKNSGKKSVKFENSLILSVAAVWLILCFSQYKLHGLIVERYFYFWFPILSFYSGSVVYQFVGKVSKYSRERYLIKEIFPYIAIFLVAISVDISPKSTYYGSMREGFEVVNNEVGESEFSIVSRPPEHILNYYLRQFDLEPQIVIGAWHSNELDRVAISELDTEIVVVMALQGGWILEESEPILEEAGYSKDSKVFQEQGDTIWVWRK